MKKILLAISALSATGISAQQAITASGGNASGSGGSSSYTVGQTAYLSKGTSNQVLEGVQQPYEILTLAVSETGSVEKNIFLYPNPVKDLLFVDFNQEPFDNASYQLFDAQGKIIKQGKFNQKKNELDLSLLPQSVYIIRIIQENKNVKAFKVIKK